MREWTENFLLSLSSALILGCPLDLGWSGYTESKSIYRTPSYILWKCTLEGGSMGEF